MVELFVSPDTDTKQKAQDRESSAEQRRRWVRLELFSPVTIHELHIDMEQQSLERSPDEKSAMILNISGGGVLLSTFDKLTPESLILLKFKIKELMVEKHKTVT